MSEYTVKIKANSRGFVITRNGSVFADNDDEARGNAREEIKKWLVGHKEYIVVSIDVKKEILSVNQENDYNPVLTIKKWLDS
jgi:hypothetical protein